MRYLLALLISCALVSASWAQEIIVDAPISNSTANYMGGLKASGVVTASFFEGDGSRLTNVPSTADWSGLSGIPAQVQAVSNSGSVSLTDLGLSGNLGIGASPMTSYPINISGTAGFIGLSSGGLIWSIGHNAGNSPFPSKSFGIRQTGGVTGNWLIITSDTGYTGLGGVNTPSATLHVSGTTQITSWTTIGLTRNASVALDVYGNISGTRIYGDIADAVGLPSFSWAGDNNTGLYNAAADTIGFVTGGNERMRLSASGLVNSLRIYTGAAAVTVNPSATLHVSGSTLTTSWTGINFSNVANVTPTAPLEVSGTVSTTGVIVTGQVTATIVTTTNAYALTVSGTQLFVGNTSCSSVGIGIGATTTGLCRPTASQIAVMIAGTPMHYFGAAGLGIGISSLPATTSLSVAGDVSVSGIVTATAFAGSGARLTSLPIYETVSLSLNSRQDNFVVTGMTSTSQVTTELRLTPTSSSVIAGIVANGVADGKTLLVTNVTSPTGPNARLLIFEREAPGATAANMITYSPMALPLLVMPGDQVALRYSTADSMWRVITPHTPLTMLTDWADYEGTSFQCFSSGTGANCSIVGGSTVANQYFIGGARSFTGSTNAGQNYVGQSAVDFNLGNGSALYVGRSAPEQLSTGGEAFRAYLGFGDASAGSPPTDAVMYAYDPSASTAWRTITFSNGSSTSNTTALTVSSTQAIKVAIFCNGDGTNCDFFRAVTDTYIYDFGHTTNIPTGTSRLLTAQAGLTKFNGTTSVSLTTDYQGIRIQGKRGQ